MGRERRVHRPQTEQLDGGRDWRVACRAADEWGILSIHELRECGLSDDAVCVRVRNGHLHPMHRGVYAVGHANPPLEGRFLAAVKACGSTAVISHFAAGAMWQFWKWTDHWPEVTVVGAGTRTHPGLRVHRTAALDPRDMSRVKGIPVTSPARTLLDLASVLEYRPLRRTVRQAQFLQRVNLSQLVEIINRHRGRRGVRRLARVIATGPAPTRSELEDVVLDLIHRGGFKHPDVNRPLIIEGRRVVPDFRWAQERLIVEADGRAGHDNKLAREDDAERQALLEAHGERVLRITWEQAVAHPAQTLRRLRGAGAPPDRPVSSFLA